MAAFGGARPQRIRLPVLFGGGCAQSGNVVVRDPLARGLFLSERSKAEDARGVDPGSDCPVARTLTCESLEALGGTATGAAAVATLTRIPATFLSSCPTVSKLATSKRRVITSNYRSLQPFHVFRSRLDEVNRPGLCSGA